MRALSGHLADMGQKSLVVLSHLPFPSLFFSILERTAPIFFEHGYTALEAACNSIASWPDPAPEATLELPFLSEVVICKLPDIAETAQVGEAHQSPFVHSNSVDRPVSKPHVSPAMRLTRDSYWLHYHIQHHYARSRASCQRSGRYGNASSLLNRFSSSRLILGPAPRSSGG